MAKKLIIGIDLGGTNLKAALLNSNLRIKDKQVISTAIFKEKRELLKAIVSAVRLLMQANRLSRNDLLGLGLGLPGPVDYKRGVVHFFPNIPGWHEVKLKAILKRRLGLPVFLDNDAKLMSLAEYRLGAAKGAKSAVCLTLGTGVGGGIVFHGRIYRGASNASAEIGHLPLNEDGPRCNCGGRACLEAYIGNRRIEKRARELFQRPVSLEELSSLAARQNRLALRLWSEAGAHLGIALTSLINLLNPERIVIGGGMAKAHQVFFAKMRQVVKRRAMRVQAGDVKILRAKLGSDAGIIGAALLVKDHSPSQRKSKGIEKGRA